MEQAFQDHYSLALHYLYKGEHVLAFGRVYRVELVSEPTIKLGVVTDGEELPPGHYAIPRQGRVGLAEGRGIELEVNELKKEEASLRLIRGKLLDERYKGTPSYREQTVKVGDKFFILNPPEEKVWFEVKEIVPTDEEKRITGWVIVKKLGKGVAGDIGEEDQ
ncbi:hypothetical protein [Stratiformator vulcanicus]|nr:hypothetical protein [Stratiformator vulcanicus]